ncbi:uncharacterized protein LOC136032408 [Artemia franciscana]|uniref:Uncharacterized protein n=1 Tax=Artemia franciscana TaxID=6661 RepID=A0AA88I7H8_ARTSF|nr:hypothetical protein QYM36_000168 [Artemia franciscana]
MEKFEKKTKEGNEEIRQEYLVNNKESQKESEEVTRQSNAKEAADPAVETRAAKSKKRQEATAVEQDAQRITGLGMDVKKEENLSEKYVKAKLTKSAKRAAAKSGTSKKGKQVEETPIAEDCNKEGFGEDCQKIGPKKLDINLPKLSRKDKKKLKKQKENDRKKSAASKMEGTGPSTFEETFSPISMKGQEAAALGAGPIACEETFSLSLEKHYANTRGALECVVNIKVEICSNKAKEKVGKNKMKEGNEEIRKEFLVNNRELQKISEDMKTQSKAKEVAEPAVETLAAKTMKRQERTAVEEDAQRIEELGIDAKKEANLPEKYVKAKSKKSAKRAAAKSGTSQNGKKVEEKPIAEDCNKEGFREDFQEVGPKKLDATLPKLSRMDKKKLKKQKENDQTKSAASKTEGAGPSTCENTFSLSLEQQSAKGQGALESAVDIKVENCSNEASKILR